MIAPHILVISAFLAVTWGIYLAFTIRQYRAARTAFTPRRGEVIGTFRRVVVAGCVWMTSVGYLLRTILILIGLGDDVAGQVTFFALLGTNVVGSLYAVVSLWYDRPTRRS